METVLRIAFISCLLISSFFQEIELKPLIYLFPLFYIFVYFFTKRYVSKFFMLFMDTITVMYFLYLAGNPFLSLMFFILMPIYLSKKHYFFSFLISGIIPVIFSFFLNGYIEYTLIVIILGFYLSSISILNLMKNYEKKINKLENNLISITSDFIKQFNKTKEYSLSNFSDISLKDEKKTMFKLFSNLNVSGISLFDIEKSKCLSVGEANCDKQFLKLIEPQIYSFKYENNWIVVLPVYKQYEISKVFFFFYKEENLIDNMNIFHYLKVKLENELLTNFKPVSNFVESVNKEVLKENNNQDNN